MSETFPLKRGLEADGVTITEQDGVITSHAPTATMTSNGIVKPDGVTTVVSDTGVISAPLSFNTVYCDSLPTKNISDRTIYFVPKSNDSGCTEYMYINGSWEIIGDTAVDLSEYAKTTDLENAETSSYNFTKQTTNSLIDDINYRLFPGSSVIETMSGILCTNMVDSSACSVDDKCYIFGGFNRNTLYYNYIQIYDTLTDICTKSSAVMKRSESKVCVCAMDKNIYILGGQSGSTKYDDIQIYDTSTNIITTSSIKMLEPVSRASATVIKDKIYIFGGDKSTTSKQTYTSKIEIYDPQTNTITFSNATLSSSGTGEYAVVYFNGLYYINTDVYDPETDTVTTSNVPCPKGTSIICVNKNKYYSFNCASSSDKVYIFNANNNTSIKATQQLSGTWCAVCSVGENCYIFGGYSGSIVNTILRFKEDIINYI